MKVAFIGLGNMGAPMAERLLSGGFDVSVFDSNPAAADRFGAAYAPTVLGVATGADVVITMLPDGTIVRKVLLETEGLLSTVAPGAVFVDMSSSGAAGTVALGRELAVHGHPMIDAPVSGGVPMAGAGTLALMVGTDDDDAFHRVEPLFSRMGVKIARMGGIGSGHATKAINNAIAAATLAITAEGLVMGTRFGIDPAKLLEVINASTGRSGVSESVFKTQIVPRKFAQGFSLALMAKDVGLADGLRDELNLELPVLAAAKRNWDAARDALKPGADFTAYYVHVERSNGIEEVIRP